MWSIDSQWNLSWLVSVNPLIRLTHAPTVQLTTSHTTKDALLISPGSTVCALNYTQMIIHMKVSTKPWQNHLIIWLWNYELVSSPNILLKLTEDQMSLSKNDWASLSFSLCLMHGGSVCLNRIMHIIKDTDKSKITNKLLL